jgi:hypothetical protein
MTTVYRRAPDLGAASTLPTYSSLSPINGVEARTKTVWERIKLFIGGYIRDNFFWALNSRTSAAHRSMLEQEITFFRDFWDRNAPFSPRWPERHEIIDTFTKKETSLEVNTSQRITVDCCSIELKGLETSQPHYNFAIAMGNLSNIRNNITGVYPFIQAYLAKRREDPTTPPARFILISQYDLKQGATPYKPETIDQAGQILASTISSLHEKYGPIHQLVGHSLGAIVMGASLKHMNTSHLPRNIYFDRGPSSIYEASKNKLGGSILYQLARSSGWDIDLGKEIGDFCGSHPELPSIVISGVKKDHHFPGYAALSQSPHILQLAAEGRLDVVEFDFPGQDLHEMAQHNIGNDQLYGHNLFLRSLAQRQFPLGREESMAQAIIARSLRLA